MAEHVPTQEEIEALAERLEVPVDLPGQLRELAKDLESCARVCERQPSPGQLGAMAEIQRDVAECLRMAALRAAAGDT